MAQSSSYWKVFRSGFPTRDSDPEQLSSVQTNAIYALQRRAHMKALRRGNITIYLCRPVTHKKQKKQQELHGPEDRVVGGVSSSRGPGIIYGENFLCRVTSVRCSWFSPSEDGDASPQDNAKIRHSCDPTGGGVRFGEDTEERQGGERDSPVAPARVGFVACMRASLHK